MRYPLVRFTVTPDMRRSLDCVLDSGFLSWLNPVVSELEEAFAKYIGSKHAIAVSSGTAALHLAYDVANVDTITIPTSAYAAVANAAFYCGMDICTVDVDRNSWNVEPAERHDLLVAVHTLGNPCHMVMMRCLATCLIEDACEALGGKWKDRKLGSIGDMGVFSFYGNKTISCGEGGMVVTNNDAYAAEIRHLMNHCHKGDYVHGGIGYNYRMTALQAAVLLPQIERIDELVAGRQRALNRYRVHLGDHMQDVLEGATHAAWLAGVSGFADAAEAKKRLALQGIDSRRMFNPLGPGPVAAYLRKTALMLPLWADMTDEDVDHICAAVRGL